MEFPNTWVDFELIDSGDGQKLERWGNFYLIRPDPQAIWEKSNTQAWNKADKIYFRSKEGGGFWKTIQTTPDAWKIKYKSLNFNIRPTSFKHTGLFPEQAVNWEKLSSLIINQTKKTNNKPRVLNLFAYTGGATVACTGAGAIVTHIDASKGMTSIAKQNIVDSNLDNLGTRFIVDDVIKFVEREIKRGNFYDGIIMDPPVYGRGPTGQLWEIEKDLTKLVELCSKILNHNPLFFLVNAYANSFSSYAIKNILLDKLSNFNLNITCGEIGLKDTTRGFILPAGLYGLAYSNEYSI